MDNNISIKEISNMNLFGTEFDYNTNFSKNYSVYINALFKSNENKSVKNEEYNEKAVEKKFKKIVKTDFLIINIYLISITKNYFVY